MEESNSTNTSKEDQPSTSESKEVLSNDQLQIKCRSLLNIAQKAKQAKNDALEKNNLLTEENKKLTEKYGKLKRDYGVANEMLATLTDQKLKLAMQLDDFKKENKKNHEELQKMNSSQEKLETEYLNYRKQYNRIISDNEILTRKLEETESQLRDAVTLQSDINQLQQNNENIKLLCSNVTQEKLELKKECTILKEKIFILEKEKEKFAQYLSAELTISDVDIDEWIKKLDSLIKSKGACKKSDSANESELHSEKERNDKLELEISNLKHSLKDVTSERDSLQEEFDKCNEKLKQTSDELKSLTIDHEKIVENLENMRVETRQLIENSEKLSDDMELLKLEKTKLERELKIQLEEKEQQIKEINSRLYEKDNPTESEQLSKDLGNTYERLKLTEEDLKVKSDEAENLRDALMQERSKLETIVLESNNLKKEHQLLENNLLKSNNELSNTLENLQETKSELEICKRDLQFSSEKLLILEKEKINLSKEFGDSITALTSTLNEKDQFIVNLTDELKLKSSNCNAYEEAQQSLQKCKDENDNLKEKLKNTLNEFDIKETSYLETIKSLNEDIKTLTSKCVELNNILKTFKNENKQKEVQNSYELKSVSDQLELVSAEFEQLKVDHLKLKNDFVEKENCLEQFMNKEKINEEKINNLIKEQDEKCNKIIEMEKTISENTNVYSKLLKEFDEVNNEYTNLKNNWEEITGDLQTTKDLFSESKLSNEKLKAELSSITEQFTKLENEHSVLKQSLENEKKMCDSLQSSVKQNMEEKDQINEKQMKELNNHIDTLTYTCSDLQRTIDELNETIKIKGSEVIEKSKAIVSLENEVDSLRSNICELENSLKTKDIEIRDLKESLSGEKVKFREWEESCIRLRNEVTHLKEVVNFKTIDLEDCRRSWLGQLTILKGAFLGLKHSYDDIKKNMLELQQFSMLFFPLVPTNIQEKITNCVEYTLHSNKQDLLSEMQQMNQALKERGEVIANLNESLVESELKVKQTTNAVKYLEEEISVKNISLDEKEKQLKFKDIFIKDLENELNRLRESNDSNADVDVMSTSTISRVDESSLLKDVEDSFEEKYTKLRILAVKLKKRASELKTALECEKTKSAEERNEFNEKIHNLTVIAKNSQILQESFDRMTDLYEEEKKKCKTLEASLQSTQDKMDSLKSEITKMETELSKMPTMNNSIETLENSLKSVKKELSSVHKEKDVEVIKYTELKKESSKLEAKVIELSTLLEQAKHQSRNSNMLELEMKNYEKTIDDLSSQLISEKDRVKHLKEEVESYDSVKSGLEEQIKLLESQIKIEEDRNSSLTTQISQMKSSIEELQSQLSEVSSWSDSLRTDLQNEKSKNESLTVECSHMSSEFTIKEKEMESQINSLQRLVDTLETKLKTNEKEYSISQSEVERVQKEFESYKLRAQSVLAKQKSDVVTQGEREAREQIEKLNAEKERLTHSLDQLLSEMEIMKTEASSSLNEKQRIEKKLEEITKNFQQKSLEMDKVTSEFRNYKISTETLKQCYKNEIEEKENCHKQELESYKNQLEDLNQKIKSMQESENVSYNNDDNCIPQFADNILESPPLEREDAEGSESVPSPVVRKYSNLVPLDVLLNTPYDSEARVNVLVERITSLEKELSSLEITSKHLASLLSEAEKDSARSTHLNSVLKEEVRRLERSLQRQPHVTNTEYLKNVIFKFVTLQNGDERSRLVPVLDTILKLSPDENHKLAAVARGEINSSWGSLLPSWK